MNRNREGEIEGDGETDAKKEQQHLCRMRGVLIPTLTGTPTL